MTAADSQLKMAGLQKTAQSEETHSKPVSSKAKTPKYDNVTQKMIHKMLTENTGKSMCDSGGAYGRNWERAQEIGDFSKIDPATYGRDDYCTKHIFHTLSNALDYDRDMDIKFNKFAKRGENAEKPWHENIDDFCEKFNEDDEGSMSINTYNGESVCSQGFQYQTLGVGGCMYVILEIHNGCDIRGGYSTPHVFSMDDISSLVRAVTEFTLDCDCGSIDNIDGDWDSASSDGPHPDCSWEDGLCEDWYWKDDRLHCVKCKKEIEVC